MPERTYERLARTWAQSSSFNLQSGYVCPCLQPTPSDNATLNNVGTILGAIVSGITIWKFLSE